MKTLDFNLILVNKTCPWFQVFQLNIDRDIASNWFDTEPHVAWAGEGNADNWSVEFDCGLKLVFQFAHQSDCGKVFATEPVAQHVGRHLKHWKKELIEYPPDMFENERVDIIARFSSKIPELQELESYQLWRQGDDGNQIAVGSPTSQLDAECWKTELESHKHKQIYWLSRVKESNA